MYPIMSHCYRWPGIVYEETSQNCSFNTGQWMQQLHGSWQLGENMRFHLKGYMQFNLIKSATIDSNIEDLFFALLSTVGESSPLQVLMWRLRWNAETWHEKKTPARIPALYTTALGPAAGKTHGVLFYLLVLGIFTHSALLLHCSEHASSTNFNEKKTWSLY